MITAQNVQDVRFSSAMSGYKKAEVDAFLDQCAVTIDELSIKNEENTRKMQVLAEAIAEYRNQEDSIRTALLSAQRMSETVLAEANAKAEAIIAEAQAKADTIAEDSKKSIQAELDELARVQKEVAAFRSKLLAIYREHLTLIGVLADETETAADEGDGATEDEVVVADEIVVDEAAQTQEEIKTEPVQEVKLDISAFALDDED